MHLNGVQGSTYSDEEVADAWYRYISDPTDPKNYDANEHPATKAGADGKFKTTSEPKIGLMQTINGFSAYAATSGIAKDEPVGAAATRYVKVLLGHLDMSELHIKMIISSAILLSFGIISVLVILQYTLMVTRMVSSKSLRRLLSSSTTSMLLQPRRKLHVASQLSHVKRLVKFVRRLSSQVQVTSRIFSLLLSSQIMPQTRLT